MIELDTSKLSSVRKCADEVLKRCKKIDVLINNAGRLGELRKSAGPGGRRLELRPKSRWGSAGTRPRLRWGLPPSEPFQNGVWVGVGEPQRGLGRNPNGVWAEHQRGFSSLRT